MPQLDSSTFLGQVTWFGLVFLGFYLILLTEVLPKLNRIVKVRVKKLERTRNDARQFDAERTMADQTYARSTSHAAASSLALLMATEDLQTKWTADTVWSLSNQEPHMAEAHSLYLDTLVQTDTSVAVLRDRMGATRLTDADLDLDSTRAHPELFDDRDRG
jgi:hypothetical protein